MPFHGYTHEMLFDLRNHFAEQCELVRLRRFFLYSLKLSFALRG